MISQKTVADCINEAERSFERCWEMLNSLADKSQRTKALIHTILSFQPELASAIRHLDHLYRKLHREKHRVIDRKQMVTAKWFAQRMRKIASFHEAINAAIDIGKTIGDAFAWLFYHDQREWLSKHEALPRDRHLPPGLGGQGEIEFIRKVPILNGCLVIYHGITTFLRLGDVSLYDLGRKCIVGIGEIKTMGLNDNTLTLQITVTGNKALRAPPPSFVEMKPDHAQLPQFMENRLRRQVQTMTKAIVDVNKPKSGTQLNIQATSQFNALTEIYKHLKARSFAHAKAGDGLILSAFKNARSPLSNRLLRGLPKSIKYGSESLTSYAKSIVEENSEENSITIAALHYTSRGYNHFHGMIPLYWWPVDKSLLYDLAFLHITLLGLYNPVFLIKKLRTNGFIVEKDSKNESYSIKALFEDGRVGETKYFPYFVNLVHRHFFEEETIVALLREVMTTVERHSDKSTSVKMLLDIQHYETRGE